MILTTRTRVENLKDWVCLHEADLVDIADDWVVSDQTKEAVYMIGRRVIHFDSWGDVEIRKYPTRREAAADSERFACLSDDDIYVSDDRSCLLHCDKIIARGDYTDLAEAAADAEMWMESQGYYPAVWVELSGRGTCWASLWADGSTDTSLMVI